MQHLSYCDSFISLSIMVSRLITFEVCVNKSFLLRDNCVCVYIYRYMCVCVCVCMLHYLFIHAFVDGHLSCFHILDIINSASLSMAL